MTYYLLDKNEKKGPYTEEELKQLKLTRTSLLWSAGMKEWTQLEYIPQLSTLSNSLPPTPPIMDLRKAPRNWLVESVVITSLFAIPFGIVGIIESIRSEEAFKRGEYTTAQLHSEKAHKWVIWGSYSVILGAIFLITAWIFILAYTHLL